MKVLVETPTLDSRHYSKYESGYIVWTNGGQFAGIFSDKTRAEALKERLQGTITRGLYSIAL